MKNFLVTGGAGFIGSHFIDMMLEDKDVYIINVDKLTYSGNLANITNAGRSNRHVFYKGDICDVGLMDGIFGNHDIDCIVNFAAESHVDRSISESEPFIRTNIMGVRVLLENARRYWTVTDGKLFVQVSSDEVYGSMNEGVCADETFPLNPSSPYSASKAAADLLAFSYYKTHGVPVMVTRSSNNFGPRQHPEKLLLLVISRIIKGLCIPVYGDGLNEREWIYVEDHCRRLIELIKAGEAGQVYNIGSGIIYRNIDIVEKLITVCGNVCGDPAIGEGLIEFIKDRKGHDRRYALDCTKANRLAGNLKASDFDEMLIKTVEWYCDAANYGAARTLQERTLQERTLQERTLQEKA